ncbi:hypothetical protein AAMO2058_000163900 [Amorphochlora amoebiformis]
MAPTSFFIMALSTAITAHTITRGLPRAIPIYRSLQNLRKLTSPFRRVNTYSTVIGTPSISADLLKTAESYPQLIDGELKVSKAERCIPIINPATEEIFACAPDATEDELNEAVEAAKRVFPSWSALSHDERLAYLEKFAAEISKNSEEIARVLTMEQGKPLVMALGEVKSAGGRVGVIKSVGPLEPEILYEDEKSRTTVSRVPVGVVAAITPWNFPVLIAVSKLASALLVGNTVVLKPSPYTPLSTLMLGQAAARAGLPAGVLNIVSGGDTLGKSLAEHPDVGHISFTGSVNTGKKVMATASAMLKKVTLELGGNDAAIVLEDADVKKAAEKIFRASMLNTGQVCTAIKRLYVHESLEEPLSEALVECSKKVRIGDGLDPKVTHGPLNNKMQYDIVRDLLEDAKKNGAEVITGGDAPTGKGFFFPPTLVKGIKEGVRLVDEEQFGPVLPIMTYKTVEEAIGRANASPFGLGGSVWTSDPDKGEKVASLMETGITWVNAHTVGDFAGSSPPFGGMKLSGIGREHGKYGLEEYTELKTVRVSKNL